MIYSPMEGRIYLVGTVEDPMVVTRCVASRPGGGARW